MARLPLLAAVLLGVAAPALAAERSANFRFGVAGELDFDSRPGLAAHGSMLWALRPEVGVGLEVGHYRVKVERRRGEHVLWQVAGTGRVQGQEGPVLPYIVFAAGFYNVRTPQARDGGILPLLPPHASSSFHDPPEESPWFFGKSLGVGVEMPLRRHGIGFGAEARLHGLHRDDRPHSFWTVTGGVGLR